MGRADLSTPDGYAPLTVHQLADEREFKGAIRRSMAIVREIEDSGYVDAADLYAQWRAHMRRLLQCADLRGFYGSAGRWGSGTTREWFAKNLLEAGKRMMPFNENALESSSEAAIVALELLTRWERTEGPAWMAKQRAKEAEERAAAKAAAG